MSSEGNYQSILKSRQGLKLITLTATYRTGMVNVTTNKVSVQVHPVFCDEIETEKQFFERTVAGVASRQGMIGRIVYRHFGIKDFTSFDDPSNAMALKKIHTFLEHTRQALLWVHCWGGRGRSSQFVGMAIKKKVNPKTPLQLMIQLTSFNYNRDLFETPRQRQFVAQRLWGKRSF